MPHCASLIKDGNSFSNVAKNSNIRAFSCSIENINEPAVDTITQMADAADCVDVMSLDSKSPFDFLTKISFKLTNPQMVPNHL